MITSKQLSMKPGPVQEGVTRGRARCRCVPRALPADPGPLTGDERTF